MPDTAVSTARKNRLLHRAGGFFQLASFLILASILLQPAARASDTIKLTTWNMDWLTLRHAGDPALPYDVPARNAADFAALRHYALALHADVIGFEEVDGPNAARLVFPPQDYDLIFTPDPVIQRVGLAIRRKAGLGVTVNPELTALNVYSSRAVHPLRGGLDVTIQRGRTRLRLLVVHLKTGCWAQPLNARKRACSVLYRQVRIIENWILDRQDDGLPFAILGDFNRRLTPYDPLMQSLQEDAPLTLTTAGFSSPCHRGEQFIDHILLGNQASSWLVPGSLRVMTYRGAPKGRRLSDHCPVSIRLALPG